MNIIKLLSLAYPKSTINISTDNKIEIIENNEIIIIHICTYLAKSVAIFTN